MEAGEEPPNDDPTVVDALPVEDGTATGGADPVGDPPEAVGSEPDAVASKDVSPVEPTTCKTQGV